MKKNITIEVPYGQRRRQGAPVRLLIEGIQRRKGSFAIRVFVGQPDADADTPLEGNDRYAGTIYLYGHGQSDPSKEAHPERAARQRAPYDQYLDLTDLLKRADAAGDTLAVSLVPVDFQQRPVSLDRVEFQRLALVSEE